MDATIRATCPSCRSPLAIPAKWVGQAVKCKKCGAVVRTKSKAKTDPSAGTDAGPSGHTANGHAAPTPVAVPQPAARPAAVPQAVPAAAVPFDTPPEAFPQPTPYEAPAYYPPAAYAAPPLPGAYPAPPAGYPAAGYPYPVPGGYPYPVPPVGYDPSQPGGYPQPVPAYPEPVADAIGGDFRPSEATANYRKRGGKYNRGGGKGKVIWLGVSVVLAAGLAAGAWFAMPYLKERFGQIAENKPDEQPPKPAEDPGKRLLTSGTGPLPRRILFVHVSNYLYLNPLTGTQAGRDGAAGIDRTHAAAMRLAYDWKVPGEKDNNQVFLVSDTAAKDGRLPMKPVVTAAFDKFFETSRGQDRIVVYFGGHALAKKVDDKDVAFLVPMEGDPDDDASLIPVADVYAKLAACKATQKVVIWDVCRFNPERGRQLPGSEPMTEELANALSAAPPGVQAVLTCQPGENALEFSTLQQDNPTGKGQITIAGSAFLDTMRLVRAAGGNAGPDDAIPVEAWAAALGKKVGELAGTVSVPGKAEKLTQTVKVYGEAPAALTAANREEPPAAKLELPPAAKGAPVKDLVAEFALPAIKDTADSGLANFPFPQDALAPYQADVPVDEIRSSADKEKYAFRLTVLEAFDVIREVWGKDGRQRLRTEFTGDVTDAMKKEVTNEQTFLAEATPKIMLVIERLEAIEPLKDKEPKRWQAHFDYAFAQAKARLAYLNEYNLALGNIKTATLPPLDPKLHNGYRLVSSETMKIKKDDKKMADDAKEIFEKMVEDYKGTPWAIQAKRDRVLSLGLAWQPYNSNAASMPAPEPSGQ